MAGSEGTEASLTFSLPYSDHGPVRCLMMMFPLLVQVAHWPIYISKTH